MTNFLTQRWLLNRWSLAAIPLGALVYLAPFLLSIAAGGSTDGLEMVYRENIRRFFDPVNHRAPIYQVGQDFEIGGRVRRAGRRSRSHRLP